MVKCRFCFRPRLGIVALGAALLLNGCVYTRGGIRGWAVEGESGAALKDIHVQHYIKLRTHWPLIHQKGEYSYKLVRLGAKATDSFGAFDITRTWIFFVPFVQKVNEERVIINLGLQADLMMKTLEDARMTNYWIDPNYVSVIDGRYKGAVIDMENSLFGTRMAGVDWQPAKTEDKFYRGRTDDRDLGNVRLFPRDAGIRLVGPQSPGGVRPAAPAPTPQPSLTPVPPPAEFIQRLPSANIQPAPVPLPLIPEEQSGP